MGSKKAYSTNVGKVLYLNPKTSPSRLQLHSPPKDFHCATCRPDGQDSLNYCSIACKASAIYKDGDHTTSGNDNSCKSIEESKSPERSKNNEIEDPAPSKSKSFRKRSRKGIPIRAPLF